MRPSAARSIAPFGSLLAMALLSAACGDLDVRSVRSPEAVPAQLEGEWTGAWQSASGSDSGLLTVRVQEFGGEPVVTVDIVNPCLTVREYQLVLTAAAVELRAGGQTVFLGTLGEGRTLVGSYQCATDVGSWTATWQRDLPALVDLSGQWTGSLASLGSDPRTLLLDLDQFVRGGTVVIEGELRIEQAGTLVAQLPLEGRASFRTADFDLALQSPDSAPPNLILSGRGELDTLSIGPGVLVVLGPSSLPFSQGVFVLDKERP